MTFLLLDRRSSDVEAAPDPAAVVAPVRSTSASLQVAIDSVRDRSGYVAVSRAAARLATATGVARTKLSAVDDEDVGIARLDGALGNIGDYARAIRVAAAAPSPVTIAAARDARAESAAALAAVRRSDAGLADSAGLRLPTLVVLVQTEVRHRSAEKAAAKRVNAALGRDARIPPGPRRVGVPRTYEGHFTSVDRLQRCYAQASEAWCTSGPSGQRVKLVAARGVYDQGRPGSRDVGGPSMPMGTRFTTRSGAITCDSSTRGITCRDSTGRGFVIGDVRFRLLGPGSASTSTPAPTSRVGVPSTYAGSFTSVDRLQRCYADDSLVACSSGPSGQQVTLTVGAGASYEGVAGSADNGAPSMPMGTSFTTPSGRLSCDSSLRGVTCTDPTTGAGFTIGDRYVIVRNGGEERRY